jgi:MFS transporter, PHS family, inorganic phosphate transporter
MQIAFYGLGLHSDIILPAMGYGSSSNVYQNLWNISIGNLILSAAGLIPGYWATFLFIDMWGRRPIQLMGFTVLTVLFVVMGWLYLDCTCVLSLRPPTLQVSYPSRLILSLSVPTNLDR